MAWTDDSCERTCVIVATGDLRVAARLHELLRALPIEVIPATRDLLALAGDLAPDVVLVDLDLPAPGTAEMVRRLRDVAPAVHVLVLSSAGRSSDVAAALVAGASGWVHEDAPPRELADAIVGVARGELFISPALASQMLGRARTGRHANVTSFPLSGRELQVLRLIASGKTNAEIARELALPVKTVKNHATNLLKKLQLDSQTTTSRDSLRRRRVPTDARAQS